jgi:hypothetical protein
LRESQPPNAWPSLYREAADEIERLRAEVDQLRGIIAALEHVLRFESTIRLTGDHPGPLSINGLAINRARRCLPGCRRTRRNDHGWQE